MNEALTEAMHALGQLQFETGGDLLRQIIALRVALYKERDRRTRYLAMFGIETEPHEK